MRPTVECLRQPDSPVRRWGRGSWPLLQPRLLPSLNAAVWAFIVWVRRLSADGLGRLFKDTRLQEKS